MRDFQNKRIIRNAAICMDCDDLIESTHRHDFKMCKCRAIGVDGGHSYLKRIGDMKKIIDISEFGPEEE